MKITIEGGYVVSSDGRNWNLSHQSGNSFTLPPRTLAARVLHYAGLPEVARVLASGGIILPAQAQACWATAEIVRHLAESTETIIGEPSAAVERQAVVTFSHFTASPYTSEGHAGWKLDTSGNTVAQVPENKGRVGFYTSISNTLSYAADRSLKAEDVTLNYDELNAHALDSALKLFADLAVTFYADNLDCGCGGGQCIGHAIRPAQPVPSIPHTITSQSDTKPWMASDAEVERAKWLQKVLTSKEPPLPPSILTQSIAA